jgi:hypothetical protein
MFETDVESGVNTAGSAMRDLYSELAAFPSHSLSMI